MKGRAIAVGFLTAALIWATLSSAPAQVTAKFITLHNFSGSEANQSSSPVRGSDGNFYGMTGIGGANGLGTVFRITPAGAFTILHSFAGGSDGANPAGTLVQGSDGNLYGTTYVGGANGSGVIFKITSAGELTPLYSFKGSDGGNPANAPVQGSDGNFYGTTGVGGAGNSGTVFQMTPAGVLTTLHSFNRSDGGAPNALVQGSDGNFYGTTRYGGSGSDGTVFQITPTGAFTTLYSFGGGDGAAPGAGLVQGYDGSFYGTTSSGGNGGTGTVFRITPAGLLTTLHAFSATTYDVNSDGRYPGALVQGTDGNFYGTTRYSGTSNGGTVFQMTPAGVLTTLHSFKGSDGENPASALAQGSDGSFYGTTEYGGTRSYGTFFKLTVPTFFTGQTALSNGVYYLAFANDNYFGYYSYLTDPLLIYHFDLGYEYTFHANDGNDGVYFYDFASDDFFYTSPAFAFPYLYDFNLQAVLYYYPDATRPGHYMSKPRYFYNFATGQVISK